MFFHNIWDNSNPIDELIFFKMIKTTNQLWLVLKCVEATEIFHPGLSSPSARSSLCLCILHAEGAETLRATLESDT